MNAEENTTNASAADTGEDSVIGDNGQSGTKGTGSGPAKADDPDEGGQASAMGGDAGTKGTGSAGLQAGDAPDAAAASDPDEGGEANLMGGDAGTKGTGSAG